MKFAETAIPVARSVALQEDGQPAERGRAGGRMVQAILLGLGVGVLVGLMGVGGGVVLVPALAFFLGMSQHLAQGTSLMIQLPPVGLGALYLYWKKGNVDLRAGLICAAGFLLGGYFGSVVAVGMASDALRASFGGFLMFSAVLLARRSAPSAKESASE